MIQLSYAIGVSQPLSIYIDLFNGDQKLSERIESIIRKEINLSPRGIREMLKLNNPIYKPTASYGHFGPNPGSDGTFTWEKTDLISLFKKA